MSHLLKYIYPKKKRLLLYNICLHYYHKNQKIDFVFSFLKTKIRKCFTFRKSKVSPAFASNKSIQLFWKT